jgi:serine/threonine-protein kinase
MAEDKGSDLDVFEGLTKKKKAAASVPGSQPIPSGPATMRGGLTPAPPASKPLPPPRSSSAAPSSLPKPAPPPSKKRNSDLGGPVSAAPSLPVPSVPSPSLPRPAPPPRRSGASPSSTPPPATRDSESPEIETLGAAAIVDEVSVSPEVAAEVAPADLDWDEEEESTNVFDRSTSDLFHDLVGKPRVFDEPDDTSKRDVGKAAALLAASGRAAASVPAAPVPSHHMPASRSAPPPMSMDPEPMPRIPAPAPVPREIADAIRQPAASVPAARGQHPSWGPQNTVPAAASTPSRAGITTLILGIVAVAVLGVAGFFYLRSSAAATVVINVTHRGKPVEAASIFIDGQKKCDFSPCKLELKPGNVNVRVVSGPLAGAETLQVEGGKDLNVDIKLGQSSEPPLPETASTTAPTAEPAKPAAMKLASTMKDVTIKVFVNGEEKGKLPLELKDLEAGPITLRFEGGEKFGKVEKTVDLKPGETFELADVQLPLLKVEVTFVLKTRGAKVVLLKDGKEEGELTFRGTRVSKQLDTTFKWTLRATLKGYTDVEQTIDFDGAGEKKTVDVELQKAPVEPATPPPPIVNTATPVEPPPPKDPPPPVDSGIINANSIPPSHVIIDGVPRGTTPVGGIKVSAGSHTVVFKHKELGTKSVTVTVGAGQTKTASVKFKKPDE